MSHSDHVPPACRQKPPHLWCEKKPDRSEWKDAGTQEDSELLAEGQEKFSPPFQPLSTFCPVLSDPGIPEVLVWMSIKDFFGVLIECNELVSSSLTLQLKYIGH